MLCAELWSGFSACDLVKQLIVFWTGVEDFWMGDSSEVSTRGWIQELNQTFAQRNLWQAASLKQNTGATNLRSLGICWITLLGESFSHYDWIRSWNRDMFLLRHKHTYEDTKITTTGNDCWTRKLILNFTVPANLMSKQYQSVTKEDTPNVMSSGECLVG